MPDNPKRGAQNISKPVIRFAWFPADDFERAREMWPAFAAEWEGYDHAAYCRRNEAFLRELSAAFPGATGHGVVVQVDGYQHWCAERDLDPADLVSRERYAAEVVLDTDPILWPPLPEQPCWCRSGRAYLACCGSVIYDRPSREAAMGELLWECAQRSWTELLRTVPDHPELLGNAAAQGLRSLITENRTAGYPDTAKAFERLAILISACREQGIDEAFASGLLEALISDDWKPTQPLRDAALQVTRARATQVSNPSAHEAYVQAWKQLVTELQEAQRPAAELQAARAALGAAHLSRFAVTRACRDLDAAIDVAVANVQEFPQADPYLRAEQLHELGRLWSIRYELTEAADAIEHGVNAARQALRAAPGGWDHRASCLSGLADLLMARYRLRGSDDDLDQATELYAECADVTSNDTGQKREHASAVQRQAVALRERFNRHGHLTDLNQAIRSLEPIVVDPRLGEATDGILATTLGGLLRLRYESLGRTSDLERAIWANHKAITPNREQTSEVQATALNNLGVAMLTRYRRLNEPTDLSTATGFLERGVAASVAGSPTRWERVHNLASAIFERYLWTRQPADADYALRILDDAQAATHDQSPAAIKQLAWRAIIVADRSQVTQKFDLAEQACQLGEQALGALPTTDDERPRLISGLAGALLVHHDHDGSGEKLARATELCEFALNVPQAHWHYLPAQCANLASALESRYAASGNRSDLDQAVNLYRDISHHLDKGDLRARLAALCTWTRSAVRRRAWQEASDAALGVRNVASRLAVIWLGNDPGQHWWCNTLATVSDVRSIVPPGTAGDPPRQVLEQGCVVLGEQARAEAEAVLNAGTGWTRPEDAARVRQAIERLRVLDHSSLDRGPGSSNPRQTATALAHGWDELQAALAATSWPGSILLRNLAESLRITI